MTYFISGHRDITQEEFDKYYKPEILDAIADKDCTFEQARFVVGDYHGVDIMAQRLLAECPDLDYSQVTVYHMFEKPRNLATDKFLFSGGYKTDEERDAAMTAISDRDIAWIRKGKWKSGTAQNILRRRTMSEDKQ